MELKIYFDLDGTLANLYARPDWLECLRAYDATPYAEAEPMCNLEALCRLLAAKGFEIGIISWRSKCEDNGYKLAVTRAKRDWLKTYMPDVTDIHILRYGTPKWQLVKPELRSECVLVDDEEQNLIAWREHGGIAISAEKFRALLMEVA